MGTKTLVKLKISSQFIPSEDLVTGPKALNLENAQEGLYNFVVEKIRYQLFQQFWVSLTNIGGKEIRMILRLFLVIAMYC